MGKILGQIKVKEFLEKTSGKVRGNIITDAKNRWYSTDYVWQEDGEFVHVRRKDETGDTVKIPRIIDLDEPLVSFFGLYSGDGAKGSEKSGELGQVKPNISFSQREPNLVRFAVDQFRRLFPEGIHFNFSLGEDSAFFMAGDGAKMLKTYYKGKVPLVPDLHEVRPELNTADQQYLSEKRPTAGTNEGHLAFYYFHKRAMEDILCDIKLNDVKKSGIVLSEKDKVRASLRRPFKKGAREPGGSSRSDEVSVGGLNGIGELFLKILHELEDSILNDTQISTQGLIHWSNIPSKVGEIINVKEFFEKHPYGSVNSKRPSITENGIYLEGKWQRGLKLTLNPEIIINPLWCYVSGLYLAEGSTPKSSLFSMYTSRSEGLSLGFTSSENISLELVLRALKQLFQPQDCLHTWKVKVGSQYFPELVAIGLKEAVPMLRGGNSGDGKLRTMEISLSIKNWALDVAPSLQPYADRYSHVEPTGAGLARIDFSASSSLCKWYFPLLMYSVFGQIVPNPMGGFSR